MKMLTAVLALIFSLGVFASRDVQTFNYDGSQDAISLALRAAKTHIEYRYEQRPEICYRREVWYSTVCHNTPQGRVCQSVPHYRDVPYTCIRTVQIPYEVHDYYTEANVNVSVVNHTGAAVRSEKLVVTLDGDQLSLSANGSKDFIIVQKRKDITSRMGSGVKHIEATFEVELIEAAPVVKALSVSEIRLAGSTLNVKTGPAVASEHIGLSLNVKKAPLLGSNTTLFDRELSQSEVATTGAEDSALRAINLNALGVKMGSGRHLLTATLFFKTSGVVLNQGQFDGLSASKTLIYKK